MYKTISTIVMIILITGSALANNNARFAGSYLRMGLGARAISLGNTGVAENPDGFTMFYNPAALGFLEEKAFSDGDLKKKHKELIALGISIVINCESCMEWHVHEALKSGATKKEILETIGVGIEMGGGPATVSSRFALKVLDYYKDLV